MDCRDILHAALSQKAWHMDSPEWTWPELRMKRSTVLLEEEPCLSSAPVLGLFSSAVDTVQDFFLCAVLPSDRVVGSCSITGCGCPDFFAFHLDILDVERSVCSHMLVTVIRNSDKNIRCHNHKVFSEYISYRLRNSYFKIEDSFAKAVDEAAMWPVWSLGHRQLTCP